MAFNVSESGAYAVLFTVLILFSLIAIASADFFGCCLPSFVNNWFVLRPDNKEEVDKDGKHRNTNRKADFFLSARDSAPASAIALSYFASGMGAWVLYGPAEMGATASISWLGVIGYAFASSAPAFVVFTIGPTIKKRCLTGSFNVTDFGRQRYGRTMQFTIAVFSIFYMFIYIVAEYTSISNIYASMVIDPSYDFDPMTVSIAIGVITILYTSVGGLPASIVTDKFQGIMVGLLVILLLFAVSLHPDNQITREQFAVASNWTTDGLMAGVTLFLAVLSAEMFNLGTWQRVWCAKTEQDMKRGFIGGSVLIFMLMMFFGIMAMVAYAKDPVAYDTWTKFSFLAFFDLLAPLAPAWHIITLVLTTSLAASSVDTLQNALMSSFSTDLIRLQERFEFSEEAPKWIARALIVILNIPAVILGAKAYDVLSLFLIADLVCACAVLPVFFGLITEDKFGGIIPAPTELGAFLGTIAGIFTVVIIGVVVEAEGGIFEYFWLDNGAICALCGSKTMITFIVTPLSAGFFCLFFSKLDVMIRGETARKPLFHFMGDEIPEEDTKAGDEEEVENGKKGGDVVEAEDVAEA
jgi:SSS family solute:Na+ symporter